MKALKIGVCILLLMYAIPGKSQSVLTISEITESGMRYPVMPAVDSVKNRTKYPNIDINSMLKIKINTALIKEEAASLYGDTTVALPVARMEAISKLLEKRTELLEAVTFEGASFTERKNALNSFALDVSPILSFVSDSLPQDNTLRITANQIFSREESTASADYADFFDALQREIDNIRLDYKNNAEANKVYFRLGAFIDKRAVHLEGFDTYKDGEFKRIQRFATSISDTEKRNFDAYAKIAADANKNAALALREKINELFQPVFIAIKDSIKLTIAEPLNQFKNGVDSMEGVGEQVKLKVAKIKSDVAYLQSEIKSFIEFAGLTQSDNYLLNLKSKLQSLITVTITTSGNISETLDDLKTEDLKTAKSSFESFQKSFNSGKKIITNFTDNMTNFFDSQTQLNISITEKIQEALLTLGAEVKKIPLENIPDETTLNLLTTGDRKDGDKLYLKAVLGKQSEDKELIEEKTIEFIPIGLYQIRLHSTISAVLIFADNTTREFRASSQFQLDPSYSVLFKLGSRKHSGYNDFVDFGFGMNMATLDFNNDNTPEIGIGLVASAFKDYLQVGYGRNMGSDDFYFFFGIRLPFLSLNLTGNAKVIPGGND